MFMIIILALKWWYSAGWRWAWRHTINERVSWVNEAFSIKALVKTWFSPFKQTYSKAKKSSIDLHIQAAVDNLVSRFVGSVLRTVIIFVGIIAMSVTIMIGIVTVLLWPFIPVLPVVSIILSALGVGV